MRLPPANSQQYLLTQIKIILRLDRGFLKLLSKYIGIIFSNILRFWNLIVVSATEKRVS